MYIKTKNSTIFTIFTIFETVSAQFAALYVYDMYDVCKFRFRLRCRLSLGLMRFWVREINVKYCKTFELIVVV